MRRWSLSFLLKDIFAVVAIVKLVESWRIDR